MGLGAKLDLGVRSVEDMRVRRTHLVVCFVSGLLATTDEPTASDSIVSSVVPATSLSGLHFQTPTSDDLVSPHRSNLSRSVVNTDSVCIGGENK